MLRLLFHSSKEGEYIFIYIYLKVKGEYIFIYMYIGK